MIRPRTAYLERKIALAQAKARARKTHLQPCDCGYCISSQRVAELFQAALERNPGRGEEVPF